MRRVGVAAMSLLFIAVLAGAAHRALKHPPGLCDGFTPAKMLEDPEFARQYFGALHGHDGAAARAHLDAIVSELRAVHGCGDVDGGAPLQSVPSERAPVLPPGHPPIGGAPPAPDFRGDATKTWTI